MKSILAPAIAAPLAVQAIAPPRLPPRPLELPAENIPARPAEQPNALDWRGEIIQNGIDVLGSARKLLSLHLHA
jgi:hypothetical protein